MICGYFFSGRGTNSYSRNIERNRVSELKMRKVLVSSFVESAINTDGIKRGIIS